MNKTTRVTTAAAIIAAVALALAAGSAIASDDDDERGWFGKRTWFGERHEEREGRKYGKGDDDFFPPVADELTQKECGDCHMAFQPAMLPARSWTAIMAGLDDHFGENAGLPAETAKQIETYLVANSGDAGGRYESEALRGIRPGDAPLRISETPYWIKEHRGEVRPGAFEDPKVGSKANCVACHRDADKGYYDDD